MNIRNYVPTMLLSLLFGALTASADPIPHVFVPETTIIATEMNDNFDFLTDRSWNLVGTSLSYSSGNVGVGTSSPGGLLHIYHSESAATANSWADDLIIENDGEVGLSILGQDGAAMHLQYKSGSGNVADIKAFGFAPGDAQMVFEVGGLDMMTLQSSPTTGDGTAIVTMNSRVGVGTSSPGGLLHIYHSESAATANSWADDLIIENDGEVGLSILGQDGAAMHLQYKSGSGNVADIKAFGFAPGDAQMVFEVGGLDMMTLQSSPTTGDGTAIVTMNSRVGIGTSSPNPSYALEVNGAALATSWNTASSRDYKINIGRVSETDKSSMLKTLAELDLSRFRYKQGFSSDNRTKLGFIAEEMPRDVVSEDGKAVDVYGLLALTIGAVQAQERENGRLKSLLQSKSAEVASLERVVCWHHADAEMCQ